MLHTLDTHTQLYLFIYYIMILNLNQINWKRLSPQAKKKKKSFSKNTHSKKKHKIYCVN